MRGLVPRLVAATLLCTACREAPQGSTSATAAIESAKVKAPHRVDVRPLTISFRGQPIARLFADGRTESAGPNAPGSALTAGPIIHEDGTIVLTKPGVTARIDDKGDVFVAGVPSARAPEQLFGHLTGDQFTFAGSPKSWDVRVHDNLIEFGEHDSSQIDGDVTQSTRHTALVMATAFYIEGALSSP